MTEKRVWLFREGNAGMRNLLGGKGANLAEMTNNDQFRPACSSGVNHYNRNLYGLY